MKKLPLFAIPGMGVDGRIFQRLELDRPIQLIEWLEPAPTESLTDFAKRMAASMPDEPMLLVGMSFGGLVAQEILQLKAVKGLVLLSTLVSPTELPLQFRLMKYLPLYELSRGDWRIRTLPLWGPWFGIHQREEQLLLQDMFSRFSSNYRMWCVKQLVQWPGIDHAVPVLRLHGSKDKVFRQRLVKDAEIISGGNHFMVYQRAEEISLRLVQQFSQWDE